MVSKVGVAVALILSVSPVLFAQDGLRSASLPERPVATPPPGPTDLFRAGPNTYRPHPDRPNPVQPVFGGWPYVVVPQAEPAHEREPRTDTRTVRIEIVTPRPEPAPAPVAPPPVASAPAVKKTLYVIPRCYAGDRPPDADTRCDLTKLRTIR